MSTTGATLRIRRMNAADLERVMEIGASLQEAPRWAPQAYLAAMSPQSSPPRIALVAAESESDNPAGFLVASLLPPQAELESIAVSAAGQRRGVGGLLFKTLVSELRTERVTEIILEVRASNHRAQAFYEAQGLKETGRRRRYYADPDEDAILMALSLA